MDAIFLNCGFLGWNEHIGIRIDAASTSGMFVWADAGCDTNALTEKAMADGMLLAPGCLFSPCQLPSQRMRINVATMEDAGVWRFLEREVGAARG